MIDFSSVIVDPRTNEAIEFEKKIGVFIPLTLKIACVEVLGAKLSKEDQDLNVSERIRRGKLIDAILEDKGETLVTEDIGLILDRIPLRYNVLVWNQCRKLLLRERN